MKKSVLFLLVLSNICVFSQSKFSVKAGKELNDQNFLKYGDKKILSFDDNAVFFTLGSSIAKITNGNQISDKYSQPENITMGVHFKQS